MPHTGKADWDGVLARFRAEGKAPRQITEEFTRVLRERSIPAREFDKRDLWGRSERLAEFFDESAVRQILKGITRHRYIPELPNGGKAERRMALRLRTLAGQDKEWVWRDRVLLLANKFDETLGWYYTRKPPKMGKDAQEEFDFAKSNSPAATERGWFLREWGKGLPDPVADFEVKLHYVLVKASGKRERIISITNAQGEWTRQKLALPSKEFGTNQYWRTWLLDNGNFTWMCGETELQALMRDLNHESYGREIFEVNLRGYHEESRTWFYDDVAYPPDGTELLPRNGVFWIDGAGYMLAQKDQEDEKFCQGLIHMLPQTPDVELRKFFGETVERMTLALGGYDAYLVLGMTAALFASPEIYHAYSGVGGLWLHGEQNQGKTTVGRWLTRFHGLLIKSGANLASSDVTPVGMDINMQQYGGLWMWFDEFQPHTEQAKIDRLKKYFDRGRASKKTSEQGRNRKPLAVPLVSGVATSDDSQLRSRYAHVLVSEKRRIGDKATQRENWLWFEAHAEKFYQFGRAILRARKGFVEKVLAHMADFMADDGMENVDERARQVHGMGYAGFAAAVDLFGAELDAAQLERFRFWLRQHCVEHVKVVSQQLNVNQFWSDILAAIAMPQSPFGEVADLRRMFKIAARPVPHPPLCPHQNRPLFKDSDPAWVSYRIYFTPDPVIQIMQQHLRRQNRNVALTRADLQDQMSRRSYWLPGQLKQRFAGDGKYCWGIEVDKHDFGFQTISDLEYDKLLVPRWQCRNASCRAVVETDPDGELAKCASCGEWAWDRLHPEVDPRKGELFALITALERKESEGEQ